MRRVLMALLGALALAAGAAPGAGAADLLQPVDLRVDGGEEAWHAERGFLLRWTNPERGEAPPLADVHYRLRDAQGDVAIAERTLGWPATVIDRLQVPDVPGAYTAEVWLEDAAGSEGPPATAKLRFDDAPPGDVEPLAPQRWLGRRDFPLALALSEPQGTPPASGLRGYAAVLDRSADGQPCAGPAYCTEAETNLVGAGNRTLEIPDLPEGLSYAHVLAVSGSGVRSLGVGTAALRVDEADPSVRLAGVPSGWSSQPVRVVATASDDTSGMAAAGGEGPYTAIRVDGGAPVTAPGDSVAATVAGSGVHSVTYYARDAAGNADDGALVAGRRNPPPGAATVRVDSEPPRLAFAGAQDPAEPERIEALAGDALSGLEPGSAQIAVRRYDSGDRFAPLPTRLDGDALRARWDSATFPPGLYEFRATIADQAGNGASSARRANGAAMLLSNPLKVATTLVAGFRHRARVRSGAIYAGYAGINRTGSGGRRRVVRCGEGAVFGGRLVAGRRAPLGGVAVQVVERLAAGSTHAERVATVRTDARGAFAVRVPPGPSREVLARAPATPTRLGAESRPVTLAVQTGVTLSVSAHVATVGGRPLVFSGAVARGGAAIPPEGKTVELQFRLRGGPWSEFRSVRTDARGRFRYAYRFADDDSRGVRFQFRAFAPAQAGWPFEPAGSRPVAVRGR